MKIIAAGASRKPAQPRAKKPELTQLRLKQVLNYRPDTGIFRWRDDVGSAKAGDVAGHTRPDGRLSISIDRKYYLANRLAWLYIKGEFPDGEVGYINGIAGDDRAENLRLGSHSIHLQNQMAAQKSSKSGVLGVYKRKSGSWSATIHVGGASGGSVHLGTFKTKEEAEAEYLRVKRIFHPGSTL